MSAQNGFLRLPKPTWEDGINTMAEMILSNVNNIYIKLG